MAVLLERLGIGRGDDHARLAVHDDLVAVLDVLGDPLAADHDGDAEGGGHDRGVVGPPARIGGHPRHPVAVQRRGPGRGDFVGDQDHGLGDVGQPVLRLPHQLGEDPPVEVHDVGGLLAKDLTVHGPEAGPELAELLRDRVLGGDPVPLDPLPDVVDERLVAKEAQVELEDQGGLGAELGGGPVAVLLQVPNRQVDRLGQPPPLMGHIVLGDRAIRHVTNGVVEDESPSDNHTGRDRDALDDLHY